jgi:hypothetical protein
MAANTSFGPEEGEHILSQKLFVDVSVSTFAGKNQPSVEKIH